MSVRSRGQTDFGTRRSGTGAWLRVLIVVALICVCLDIVAFAAPFVLGVAVAVLYGRVVVDPIGAWLASRACRFRRA